MSIIKHILVFISILVALYSVANDIESPGRVQGIPGGNALAGATVSAIHVDSKGCVWLGTERGLMLTDGYHTLDIPLSDGDSQPFVIDIMAKDEDQLWIVTNEGLFALNTSNTFQSAKVAPDAIQSIQNIIAGPDHTVIASNDEGAYIVTKDGRITETIALTNSKGGKVGKGALSLRKDILYIGSASGLYAYNLKTKESKVIDESIRNITCMLDVGPNLLIGSGMFGLWDYNVDKNTLRKLPIKSNVVTSLVKDSRGLVFVGTDGDGVFSYNPTTCSLERYLDNTIEHGRLPNNQVYALACSPRDQLFIGFYRAGASYIVKNSHVFAPYTTDSGFDSSQHSIRAIDIGTGYMAVGTRNGLYMLLSKDVKYFGPEQIGSKLVLCLKSDGNDLYIGTYGGGLSRLDLTTCMLLPIDDSIYPLPKTGSVFSMAHDRSGALWVASSDGLYKLCEGKIVDHVCTTDQSNALDLVMEIYFDSLDRGWVCTRNGIGILDTDNHKVSFDSLPENFIQKEDIRDIYEGHNGNLYFIANNGNIWCFDSQLHLQPISSALHQIPNARGVIQDYRGHLWITTANGLFRINLGDGEIRQFDSADGLESAMFNVCKPKIDENGRLWLGNSLGLLSVDISIPIESRLSSSRVRPIAAKTEECILSLLNSSQGIHSVINLDYNVDNFNLMLSDLAFSGSHNDRYEYSLNNGRTWMAVPDELTITFNSLPYGNTNMIVRQKGNNATETVIEIHNPYRLRSILMFCLIAVLIIISVLTIWKRWRGNHNRKGMPKADANDATEQGIEYPNADSIYDAKSQSKKYAPNYLSDTECRTLAEKLTAILKEEKLYTNPDLKINTLSSRLGVSSHKLSYLFSQFLKTSYYDYIYQYRVAEFKRIAKEDINGRYTLIALSEMAGFNSRATFFRIFKKSEGITPGEYLQKLRDGEI